MAEKKTAATDASKDDVVKDAVELWALGVEKDRHNRQAYEDDTAFARLEEQWHAEDKKKREDTGRPCLTINQLGPIIRQVVNDSRQNKPAIKVMPQDSHADLETADIYSGLIRNIETSSDADTAYDTAVDNAVTGGFGYFAINLEYACDDNWDQDIVFRRIADPLSVVGDPFATSADGSDWNDAFITDLMPKKAFERQFPDADAIDWQGQKDMPANWAEDDRIRVAEYWTREQVAKQIVLLTDGRVVSLDDYKPQAPMLAAQGVTVQGSPRSVMSYKVTQRLLTGTQELSKTDWAGKYIPIVPVYGDEIVLRGKRHFRSLIRSAKDAQRIFNYQNSLGVELGALAPKAPFIGPKGAFETDATKWEEIHTTNHPFVQYDGDIPPQRQPFSGAPSGAIEAAAQAADWIHRTTGIYNASLGAPSNETSGKAILARQHEGDVSTFHFIDNLSRSIRHGGRILIDLIPKVYSEQRVIRVLGVDGKAESVTLGQPTPQKGPDGQPMLDPQGQAITRIFDLDVGKYDLTVKAGPSFSTRREEAAQQMIDFIQAYPAAAAVIGDKLAQNLDWPGADEIAARLKAMLPAQVTGGPQIPPELQDQIEHGKQLIQQQQTELQAVKDKIQGMMLDRGIDDRKNEIAAFNAETDRLKVTAAMMTPDQVGALVIKTINDLLNSPDVLPPTPGQPDLAAGPAVSAPVPAQPVQAPMAQMNLPAPPGQGEPPAI